MANPSAMDMDLVLRSRAARVSPGRSFMVKNKKLAGGLLTMKDVIDGAKIWVAHLPGKQHFAFEPLAQGGIIGNLRKNGLQGDVDALQETVLRLIDFAHPSLGDEADNHETIDQDLAGLEPPSPATPKGFHSRR